MQPFKNIRIPGQNDVLHVLPITYEKCVCLHTDFESGKECIFSPYKNEQIPKVSSFNSNVHCTNSVRINSY